MAACRSRTRRCRLSLILAIAPSRAAPDDVRCRLLPAEHLTTVARGRLACRFDAWRMASCKEHCSTTGLPKNAGNLPLLVNPRQKQKLQEMAAAWDLLAIERKRELDEKKPDREP